MTSLYVHDTFSLTSLQSNGLQIQLEVSILNGLVVMPAGLRGYESDQPGDLEGDIGTCVMLALPELQIHLRTHDYYMGKI